MPKHLTKQQLDFAHALVLDGLTQTAAYAYAYAHKAKNPAAKHALYQNAYRTRNHPAVAHYIAELQAQVRTAAQADMHEKLTILEAQMRDPDLPARERREAIKLHNEMTGDNAPVKHEITFTKDDFTALALDLAS